MEFNLVNNKYSEEFLRDYVNNNKLDIYDWDIISLYQKLSEEFIREFKDKVDWEYISEYQILSENFIREFKNKVYWPFICKYQILSINFIDDMIQEGFIINIFIYYLLVNEKINQEELRGYLSI